MVEYWKSIQTLTVEDGESGRVLGAAPRTRTRRRHATSPALNKFGHVKIV